MCDKQCDCWDQLRVLPTYVMIEMFIALMRPKVKPPVTECVLVASQMVQA